MKIKVMTVFGTRPEAIKMAPLVLALRADERFEAITTVTAQHREMLDSALEIFKIKPDYDLNLMHKGQTLQEITADVLTKIDGVIEKTPLKTISAKSIKTSNQLPMAKKNPQESRAWNCMENLFADA